MAATLSAHSRHPVKVLYSLDVFDTCLCRLCGEPRMLLEVLSLRLQRLMGEGCDEHLRRVFVAARATGGGGPLEEVYRRVALHFPLPVTPAEIAALELQTEREMLRPIEATRRLVEELRTKGDGSVAFISDMYLPSQFLVEVLAEHGFWCEGDRIYVSDELGAYKRDGSLFRLVQQREGVSFHRWHHWGDNQLSDYSVPRRLGIHAHRVDYGYLPYERQWMESPVVGYQWAAMLAGVARAVRLSTSCPADQQAFVGNVSAPLMTSWTARVMADAQRRGIRRLYFCARDMHSFFHIARQLSPLFPEVEVHYLFISGPALYDDARCIDYLRQEGMADGTAAAIVDSCSSGKTLTVLNRLLTSHGLPPVEGYFWAQMTVEGYQTAAGHYLLVGDYLNAITPRRVSCVMGMRILYELFFSLNFHRKTYGYALRGDRLRPVLREDRHDAFDAGSLASTRRAKRANDQLLCNFADGFAATGLVAYSHEVLHHLALPTLVAFSDRPHKEYLHYLARVSWWHRPFVGRLWGKGRGVWRRGNLFYSLPSWAGGLLRWVLTDSRRRSRVSQLLSALKRITKQFH
ncbi:MAG: hypothetical protein IJU19_03325 [Bacteroidales bacterium]|nr:hypothetical protein [Bacteroidales bacterium]